MAWRSLHSVSRSAGLPRAHQRRDAHGLARFSFVHQDLEIDDPALDLYARHFVSPQEYGFTVRQFEGGRTAWARDFDNGTMLVLNPEGGSHVLSPKLASRVVFVDWDGHVLQDTGLEHSDKTRNAETATVRLTLTASYDLQSNDAQAARAALIGLLDSALAVGQYQSNGGPVLTDYSFESSSLIVDESHGATATDFSKLLDL